MVTAALELAPTIKPKIRSPSTVVVALPLLRAVAAFTVCPVNTSVGSVTAETPAHSAIETALLKIVPVKVTVMVVGPLVIFPKTAWETCILSVASFIVFLTA
jgi:hypothetical protein